MLPLLFKIRPADDGDIRMYVREKDPEELHTLRIIGHKCRGNPD